MLANVLTTRGRSADFSGEPVQVGASGNPGFDERLTREILQSERTRMLIVAGLSGSLVVIFPVLVLVFRQNYAGVSQD
jgi:VIT1/CCC1 family predicted Fe2+/Mn2+ transporter